MQEMWLSQRRRCDFCNQRLVATSVASCSHRSPRFCPRPRPLAKHQQSCQIAGTRARDDRTPSHWKAMETLRAVPSLEGGSRSCVSVSFRFYSGVPHHHPPSDDPNPTTMFLLPSHLLSHHTSPTPRVAASYGPVPSFCFSRGGIMAAATHTPRCAVSDRQLQACKGFRGCQTGLWLTAQPRRTGGL